MALAKIYLLIGNLPEASRWVASSLDATTKSGVVSDLPTRLQLLAQLQQQQSRYAEATSDLWKHTRLSVHLLRAATCCCADVRVTLNRTGC